MVHTWLADWATAVAWITIARIAIAGIAIHRISTMPPLGSRFRRWFWFWFWLWFWCCFQANEKEDTNTKNQLVREHVTCVRCAAWTDLLEYLNLSFCHKQGICQDTEAAQTNTLLPIPQTIVNMSCYQLISLDEFSRFDLFC